MIFGNKAHAENKVDSRPSQDRWVPRILLSRCEGCGACAGVCPHGVLELRDIEAVEYQRLGWIAKMKLRHHGMKVVDVAHAEKCRSCGQCRKACHEHAIQ